MTEVYDSFVLVWIMWECSPMWLKYIPDLYHVIQVDDVQVRENLIVETSPLSVEDR